MPDRPIEQSHYIIVGRTRAIVEPHQPMHRPETDGPLQSARTARKLTRHGEYQSSPRPARLVELGVSARQRKCSDKAVPVLLAEFALQPAMRVVDPTRASTIIGNWQRQNRSRYSGAIRWRAHRSLHSLPERSARQSVPAETGRISMQSTSVGRRFLSFVAAEPQRETLPQPARCQSV
jgi:hypothetical protein